MYMNDVQKLGSVISRKFGNVKLRNDYGWFEPALDVLDCVLSLNRRYDSFVVPRIENFRDRNPNITGLKQLLRLIKKYRTPLAFSKAELQYNHKERVETLLAVICYLIKVQRKFNKKSERARLRAWARSVKPTDYTQVEIAGFGLAGFQYLRMLFGVQTTKPGNHIKRFVSEVVGFKVNELTSLSLLEQAAKQEHLLLREVDGAIWRSRAR